MSSAPSPSLPTGGAPVAPPTGGGGSFRGLIAQKEKELHDINEYRIHTLETLLQEKERELAEHKQQKAKLKEDFNYNLKLLEERDGELERYDSSFSSLKSVIRDRDVELSELKIAAAELQHAAKQERDRAAEAESYYQQKLAALREEAEAVRWKKEDEVRAQRDEFEAHKREAQRQLHEAAAALELERREAAAAFDDAGRQREREHAAAVDEALARVGAAEAAARASEGQLAHARAQRS